MNKAARTLIFTVILALAVIVFMNALGGPTNLFGGLGPKELTFSELKTSVSNKLIEKVEWQQNEISGQFTDGKKFVTRGVGSESATGSELIKLFDSNNVRYEIKNPPVSQGIVAFLSMFIAPILLVVLFYFIFIRPAQMGGNQALSFGRSRAKRASEQATKVTFEDVAGVEEAKQELWEIVDFLKNTKKYVALGAKIPRGILLTGPPGVGKTHLARAIAGEAGVPFFHISGSDFVEMFVGVGAARVRDTFETAKAHRPCLIFVDEIDAVGRQRGAGLGGGHDEREQTLNQLLVEMDGFDPNAGVIVIAATNRPDVLDPALLRPGRFDRNIVIDTPDTKGREAILRIHSKGKPFDDAVQLETIAKRTPGFTGADLANALNESALLAARKNQTKIMMPDIEEALDRVIAGPQRRSRVIDKRELETIAYHEAGHAIVGELLEHCDPVHKVTILPRGLSLGSTWSLPEQDKHLHSEEQLLDEITMTLGGRAAEELVFNSVTTGASGDLERVTRIARAMICEYGMSKKLGTRAVGRRSRNPFLGRDYGVEDRDYSEDVARLIDAEIHELVENCYQRAEALLKDNREKLNRVVKALLERETLNRDEFLAVLNGEELPALVPASQAGPPSGALPAGENKEKEKAPNKLPSPKFEPGPA